MRDEMQLMKYIKITKNVVYGLLIAALIVIVGGVVLSRFDTPFSYRLFSVESGSMEPDIHVGSVVAVIARSDYTVGDVITFRPSGSKSTVTHRIAEAQTDSNTEQIHYTTKGDANSANDVSTISKSQIIGAVVFSIPLLGYPVMFAQTQMGFVMLIIIPSTIIVYHEVLEIKKEMTKIIKKKVKENEKSKPEEL